MNKKTLKPSDSGDLSDGAGASPHQSSNKKNAEKIYRFLNNIKKKVELGTQVVDTINEIGEKPQLRNYVGAGLHLMNIGLSKMADRITSDSDGAWKHAPIRDVFADEIDQSLAHIADYSEVYASRATEDSLANDDIVVLTINGKRVKKVEKGVRTQYSIEENVTTDEFSSWVGKGTWDRLGPRITITTERLSYGQHVVKFVPTSSRNILPSSQAHSILERVKKFHDKKKNRSIILDGNPGTGKSTIMKYVAENIGGLVLTISVSEFVHLSSDDIMYSINSLKPTTILVDDFDRMYDSDEFLSELELINQEIKLFMVSVNDPDRLPKAAIRPGRFDEIVKITTIDKDVILNLIPWASELVIKRVENWPVAFIDELSKRASVLGNSLDTLENEFKELEERISKNVDVGTLKRKNNSYGDYDDDFYS